MSYFKKSRVLPILFFLSTTAACSHEEHHAHAEPPKLKVIKPIQQDAELVDDYVCQIRAAQHIEVRAIESGYLQDIYVDEGQIIEDGQRMFQIMPMIVQAELEKASAEAEFASVEFKNTELLATRNIVSPNELALATARRKKAEAEVSLARAHRKFTEIRAPFTGIMDRLEVRKGSLLEEGELLTSLSDVSVLWVYFNVTEAQYLDYQEQFGDQHPEVELIMANGKTFEHKGVVETIEADFDNETGTIAFRARFSNPNRLLRHGETGKIRIRRPLENVVMIPQKATFEILDKRYVFVVDEHGTVRSKPVTVAHELPHLFVVSDGLETSETVLLEGLRKVREGEQIIPDLQDPKTVLSALESIPAE